MQGTCARLTIQTAPYISMRPAWISFHNKCNSFICQCVKFWIGYVLICSQTKFSTIISHLRWRNPLWILSLRCSEKLWDSSGLYSWFGTDFLLKGNSRQPPVTRSSEPWHNITQFFTHWQKLFRDMKLTVWTINTGRVIDDARQADMFSLWRN